MGLSEDVYPSSFKPRPILVCCVIRASCWNSSEPRVEFRARLPSLESCKDQRRYVCNTSCPARALLRIAPSVNSRDPPESFSLCYCTAMLRGRVHGPHFLSSNKRHPNNGDVSSVRRSRVVNGLSHSPYSRLSWSPQDSKVPPAQTRTCPQGQASGCGQGPSQSPILSCQESSLPTKLQTKR